MGSSEPYWEGQGYNMTKNNYTQAFLQHTLETALLFGVFDEAVKRIHYCPFDINRVQWKLVHSDGPLFFALRDLLRKSGKPFTVCPEPFTLTSVESTLFITAETFEVGSTTIRIRGHEVERSKMPLYIEAGQWDVPQMNPVFDWSEAQAWAYLLNTGLINDCTEDVQ